MAIELLIASDPAEISRCGMCCFHSDNPTPDGSVKKAGEPCTFLDLTGPIPGCKVFDDKKRLPEICQGYNCDCLGSIDLSVSQYLLSPDTNQESLVFMKTRGLVPYSTLERDLIMGSILSPTVSNDLGYLTEINPKYFDQASDSFSWKAFFGQSPQHGLRALSKINEAILFRERTIKRSSQTEAQTKRDCRKLDNGIANAPKLIAKIRDSQTDYWTSIVNSVYRKGFGPIDFMHRPSAIVLASL